LHPGDRGPSPRRSTEETRAHGPTERHRPGVAAIPVRLWVGPLTYIRKVAGYGLPGRTANACPFTGIWVQIPCLPLTNSAIRGRSVPSPMVKRTSSLASNEVFRVRVLVGLLTTWPVVVPDSMTASEAVGPGSIPGRATYFTACECAGSHGRLRICKTGFDSSAGY
jgi:hypothetical protein